MAARILGDARIAVAFLTRIPVGDRGSSGASATPPLDAAALSRSAVWFPAVGLLVGGVLGGTRLVADLAVDPAPATLLALLAAILVTGALHEDGLADVADAAGAHTSRERRLEILKDPRVGTYGALAIGFMILLPFSVLATLDGEDVLRAALVAHVLGRWSALPQAVVWSPARPTGSGALLRPSRTGLIVATAFAVGVVVVVAGLGPGLLAVAAAATLTAGLGSVLAGLFGGVTGDSFGAVNKTVEIMTYVALVAVW